jgi:hypothetical protein
MHRPPVMRSFYPHNRRKKEKNERKNAVWKVADLKRGIIYRLKYATLEFYL